MHSTFPLFLSHIDLAHQYWSRLLQPGDTAIDATCGNGKDTLKLAQILFSMGIKGKVIGIDIQADAIARTRRLLSINLPPVDAEGICLYEQSHASFPDPIPSPIRLIVYNLGYLPGSDKLIKTTISSTLPSVNSALDLIVPGGAVSITCYPGHKEGAEEQEALLKLACRLDPQSWNICHHRWINSPMAPSLLLIQKTLGSVPR